MTRAAKKQRSDTCQGESIERSSGNVFADMDLPDAKERLAKAQLIAAISAILEEKKITQKSAGKLLGIDQSKVSKLLHGRLGEFSLSTLMVYLTVLDQDVEIVVRKKKRASRPATIQVNTVEAHV